MSPSHDPVKSTNGLAGERQDDWGGWMARRGSTWLSNLSDGTSSESDESLVISSMEHPNFTPQLAGPGERTPKPNYACSANDSISHTMLCTRTWSSISPGREAFPVVRLARQARGSQLHCPITTDYPMLATWSCSRGILAAPYICRMQDPTAQQGRESVNGEAQFPELNFQVWIETLSVRLTVIVFTLLSPNHSTEGFCKNQKLSVLQHGLLWFQIT
jgi:hypothetical protein